MRQTRIGFNQWNTKFTSTKIIIRESSSGNFEIGLEIVISTRDKRT